MATQSILTSPYADYEFYKDTFLGEDIQEDDFRRMELRAEEKLNAFTFGRIKLMDEKLMTDDLALTIRKAVCAMAEEVQRSNPSYADLPGGVSSENLDGYAVSYAGRSSAQMHSDHISAMKSVAVQYLGHTGLLYRGGGDWYDN